MSLSSRSSIVRDRRRNRGGTIGAEAGKAVEAAKNDKEQANKRAEDFKRKADKLKLDFDDEITTDAVITHDGRVTSRLLQTAAA